MDSHKLVWPMQFLSKFIFFFFFGKKIKASFSAGISFLIIQYNTVNNIEILKR